MGWTQLSETVDGLDTAVRDSRWAGHRCLSCFFRSIRAVRCGKILLVRWLLIRKITASILRTIVLILLRISAELTASNAWTSNQNERRLLSRVYASDRASCSSQQARHSTNYHVFVDLLFTAWSGGHMTSALVVTCTLYLFAPLPFCTDTISN